MYDSLGSATSQVIVDTGDGDDVVTLSNEASPIDPLSTHELSVDDFLGDVIVEAGAGSNSLLIDDQGDPTGDTIVQLANGNDVQITGMAAGDIFYRATGGTFADGLELITSSGSDTVTLQTLHGTDHTELYTGDGDDDVIVENFVVDAGAQLTIYTENDDDLVDASASPVLVTVFGATGNDTVYGSDFDDVLHGDQGNDLIIGNFGQDTIDSGDGNDIVIGDRGYLHDDLGDDLTMRDWPALAEAASTLSNGSSNDTITTGEGDDVVFGGSGDDDIDAAGLMADRDIVVGDHGMAHFDASGLLLDIATTDPAQGGSDFIRVGDGDDVVLGGSGTDYINIDRVGVKLDDDSGNDVILGDNGSAVFDTTGSSSVLTHIETSDPTTATDGTVTDHGAADFIFAADGSDVVFGGSGGDDIDAGTDAGRDIVVGDQGVATFTATGLITDIATTQPGVGGDDDISVGDGDDLVLGGTGSDAINVDRATGANLGTDTGNDVILGDNGSAVFDTTGSSSVLTHIETADPTTATDGTVTDHGAADLIFAADGSDVVFGGSGGDDIDAGTDMGRDVVVGDHGSRELRRRRPVIEHRHDGTGRGRR